MHVSKLAYAYLFCWKFSYFKIDSNSPWEHEVYFIILGCNADVVFSCQDVLDTAMMVMKIVVGYCTEENQSTLVQKAYNLLPSTIIILLDSLNLPLSNSETLQSVIDNSGLTLKDEWLLSLFASVVIALHPKTPLTNVRAFIKLFTVFLLKGHLSAAHALASMINKWPADITGTAQPSSYKLEEAIDVVLESILAVLPSGIPKECVVVNSANKIFCGSITSSLQIQTVIGLAWIGKGLLMRGHERVKEIAMLLLKVMITSTPPYKSENGNGRDVHSLTSKAAADAFHTLLSDSEVCLNKKFHSTVRPLYKQRFFSSMVPVLLSSIKESSSSSKRYLRAFIPFAVFPSYYLCSSK